MGTPTRAKALLRMVAGYGERNLAVHAFAVAETLRIFRGLEQRRLLNVA